MYRRRVSEPDLPDELDPALEWKLRAAAIPSALVIALGFFLSPVGHAVQRTFLTMIPHELGHATTGWLFGYAAIPGLWKTMIPDERSTLVSLVIAAILAFVAYRAWRTDRLVIVLAAALGGAAVFVATTSSSGTALTAFTFGGDAGALVIGTVLVLAFFVPRARRGGLRWGLLAIGAATYVDVAMSWWQARKDSDAIPYGVIEGVGLSDPTKLVEVHGWSEKQMIARYVGLAGVCLASIVAVWMWQTLVMRRRAA